MRHVREVLRLKPPGRTEPRDRPADRGGAVDGPADDEAAARLPG